MTALAPTSDTRTAAAPVTADGADPAAPPLVRRLVDVHGAVWVDAARIDAFIARPGRQVLFFSGDPVRFPECLDVAVVLPELQAAFPGRFGIGVVTRADEDALARRYAANRWPSLVVLDGGRYVATLPGMLDWTDFLAAMADALDKPPSRVPGIGIAVVADGAGPSCH